MITVADILSFVDSIAPPYMKMDWDNAGLLCGSKTAPVTRILVALDPFEHVCREAVEVGAELIVTHHPIIFRPISSLTDDTATQRGLMLLCAKGISAINAHTNLDCAPGGVNDVLAATLGLKDVQVIAPMGTDAAGRPWGLLRMGTVPCQSLEAFMSNVKNKLQCKAIRYVDGGKPVHTVAVGGGSCGSELRSAIKAGCDTFVTADIKYNDFWEAQEQGLSLIDAGHFPTENPVCTYLKAKIQEAFPEIQVIISKKHRDCMNFFL